MDGKKKKVTALLYDRISERVVSVAGLLNRTPNELINSFAEECLRQIEDDQIPRQPIETVKLARLIQRRNLTRADQLLQDAVKVVFPDLDKQQEKFRNYVLELANIEPGPLTTAVMVKIKARADKMVEEDTREERRRTISTKI